MAPTESESLSKVKIRSVIDYSGTGGSSGVFLRIPTLSARLGCVVNANSQPIYTLYRAVIWPQGSSGRAWRTESLFSSREYDPGTIQPVASGFTDCAKPGLLQK
jgi:hypothetical protein